MISNTDQESSTAAIRLLMGDYHRNGDFKYQGKFVELGMPVEADYSMIRRNLWLGTDMAYKQGLQAYSSKMTFLKANPKTEEEEAMDDLCRIEPITKIVERKNIYKLDKELWEQNVRELSAIFKDYKQLINSSVVFAGVTMDIYQKTTEGVTIKLPQNDVNLKVQASVMTDEGISFDDNMSIIAATLQDMASMEELKKKVKKFADNLSGLREVEAISEFYSGPILFEDGACFQISGNNLLAPEALLAHRRQEDGKPITTLEDRIGKRVIDNRISVKNYSTLAKYNHVPLIGRYEIDAEGVVPKEELILIENGILKQMLNGRFPTLKNPQSTGSSRFSQAANSVSFLTAPGTIHIAVNSGCKPEK